MSIQKRSYNGRSFVLHKIPTVAGTKAPRMSAYFDENGQITDAEFMPSERQVKRGSANWRHAERMGKMWKDIKVENTAR